MRRKPYVILSAGLAVAFLTFLASLFVTTGSKEPLPIQEPDESVAMASSATAPTTTTNAATATTTHNTDLKARRLDQPDLGEQRLLPSALRPLDATCDEPTLITPPAPDFASVVAAAKPGTCFLLEDGQYEFHNVIPKDYMTFIGRERGAVVVKGSAETENAFHGTATGVSIGRMTLTGFQGTGGQKPQEQGAIRGTVALWHTNPGELANDWLIEDVEASNNSATGVFLGDHFTVRGSTFVGNGISGLGGSRIVGGLIEQNVISANGAQGATDHLANSAGMKFTEAASLDDPLVVRQNEIFGNSGIGVWCDLACEGFHVLNNYIHDEKSQGVMFELSSNAVIRGNLLVNTNSWSDYSRDFNAAAITIGESSDAIVEENYIDQAVSGIIVRQTKRPVEPQETFLLDYENVTYLSQRVRVRNNVIVNTKAMGISEGTTGQGLIPDRSSIRFEDNTYSNSEAISYWWSGDEFNFEEWQASGRDLGGSETVPARPAWP